MAQAMGFFTDTTVCIGCKACEVACKEWNQLPAENGGVRELSGDSYDNTRKLDGIHWRHVRFIEQFKGPYDGRWLMMSDVCKHCVQAGCLDVCPTGAIIRTQFDTVVIQSDVCNGCRACIAACPFGVIDINPVSGTAQKCTLCYDRLQVGLEPACSKACPTDSIQFGAISELRTRAEKRVAQLKSQGVDAQLYGASPTGPLGGLNSFYLLVDKPEVYGLPAHPELPSQNLRKSAGLSVASAAVMGVLALVGLRKRRMGVPRVRSVRGVVRAGGPGRGWPAAERGAPCGGWRRARRGRQAGHGRRRPAGSLRRRLHRRAAVGHQPPDLGGQPVARRPVSGVGRVDGCRRPHRVRSAARRHDPIAGVALVVRYQGARDRIARPGAVHRLARRGEPRVAELLGAAPGGGSARVGDPLAAPPARQAGAGRAGGETRAARGLPAAGGHDARLRGNRPLPRRRGDVAMIARRAWLALLAISLVECASPEAKRVRGGGPGADPGNHDRVTQVHGGAQMYYRTPCRTVKVKCSGPTAVFGDRGT